MAKVPQRYADGCTDPKLVAGADRRVNAGRLAGAYGRCKRLQRDTVTWTERYLKDLGRK